MSFRMCMLCRVYFSLHLNLFIVCSLFIIYSVYRIALKVSLQGECIGHFAGVGKGAPHLLP